MEAETDINNEYEKLFGRAKSINLFDTDEEYETLREYVFSQSSDYIRSRALPFDDIKLMPYNEYIWKQEIESATNDGKHVFYIKQSQPFCKAACYFDASKGNIVLLRYSYIANSNSYNKDFALLTGRRKLLMNKSCQDKKGRYLTENVRCPSPLVTASYVLGRKADLSEWCDEKGKSIVTYYSELARLQAQEIKKKEKEKDEQNKGIVLLGLLNGIANYLTKKTASRHIFYIEEDGVCSASGYLEEDSKQFFIQKGSLVSKESDILYASSQSGKARLRFLDKACVLKAHYYCVSKDAKCRSASAAAWYGLGRKADFTAWKDDKGKSLEEVYPNRFFAPQTESSQLPFIFPPDEPPLFHIVKTDDAKRFCRASGTYDSTGNQFLILKDSILSLDVSSSYRYTASDYQRQKFIKLNCVKKSNGFVMKRDALCDSPSAAASFVLGRSANGWLEWKDESNRTLKEVYNH